MSLLSILVSTASCAGLPYWACDAQSRTGIDPRLIYAVCMVESSGNEKAITPEDGNSTSYGICQIKLATAKSVGFKGTAAGLMEPSLNALYASRYLITKLNRYKSLDQAVSAYNAGRAVTFNKLYVLKVLLKYQHLIEGDQYEERN